MFKWGLRPESRGHDPGTSLAALAGLEPAMLGLAPPAPRRFHVVGKWCLSDALLRRLFRGPDRPRAWAELRSISNFTPLSLAALLPGKRTIKERSHAAAVVLRTNIRAIYPELGLTAKLSNPMRPEAGAAIRHEAEFRQGLKGTDTVRVPVLHVAGDHPTPFLAEVFVVGAERRRSNVPGGWAAALFDFYEANGIEARPLGGLLDFDAVVARAVEGCRALNVDPGAVLLDFIRERKDDPSLRDGLVLEGVCHGDLAPSNLLFSNGRTVIADWEYGERNLLFSDVARLAAHDEPFRKGFLDEAAARAVDRPAHLLRPETQLIIGCLVAAGDRFRRFEMLTGVVPRRSLEKRYGAKVRTIMGLAARIAASR